MNLFNRLVTILLAVLLALAGVSGLVALGGGLTSGVLQEAPGLRWLEQLVRELPAGAAAWAMSGALLSLVAGLALLVLELRVPGRGRELMIRRDRLGCVSVSLAGLRRLADHVVGGVPGVEAVISEARQTRDGVTFRCRVVVEPEASTPELAAEIRSRVGEAVRRHIGQSVTRVHVHAQVGLLANRKRVR
jgi:hypothetical protein